METMRAARLWRPICCVRWRCCTIAAKCYMARSLARCWPTGQNHGFKFSEKELADLSQFLTASVNGILRSGYNSQPTNLLSGDAKAGEAYFNGTGGCSKCHSVSGDLAGVAKRYSVAGLQQKFLFPSFGLFLRRKVQVTVTLASGKSYAGDLVSIDDFTVSLREKSGSPAPSTAFQESRSRRQIPMLRMLSCWTSTPMQISIT